MKRAFTLIELLVVITIIGIIAGVLITSFSGSTEKVRSVKCAANLKSLAAAVGSYSMNRYYPYAQSAYRIQSSASTEENRTGVAYYHQRGWLSFYDPNVRYPLSAVGSAPHVSLASDNDEQKTYAITNGAIWSAVGMNRDCYMCPEFRRICERKGVREPGWSYQMSAFFGYESERGKPVGSYGIEAISLTRADRRLLFAEIQALELTEKDKRVTKVSSLPEVDLSAGNEEATDGCLVYQSKNGNESIGFNHRRGRDIVGHVAFADGHVETLIAPQNGSFVELTDYLCRGMDYVYRDGRYQEIDDEEN